MVSGGRMAAAGAMALIALSSGSALADSATGADAYARYSAVDAIVLAVRSDAGKGSQVRLSVYSSPDTFLEQPAARLSAVVGEDGVAIVPLHGLSPGEYSFVAYLDQNGDGKLNRNPLGKPTEPFIFSNDIKPKLKRPSFDQTKVFVAPGEVVVLTLKG